jgi:hypothetical protein
MWIFIYLNMLAIKISNVQKSFSRFILFEFDVKHLVLKDFLKSVVVAVSNFCHFQMDILIDTILLYYHKNFQTGF